MTKSDMEKDLPALLQDFFLQRLIQQRSVSQNTVKSYRDTFRLLLRFAEDWIGKSTPKLQLTDLARVYRPLWATIGFSDKNGVISV
jgi:integrase/recombinase XerD